MELSFFAIIFIFILLSFLKGDNEIYEDYKYKFLEQSEIRLIEMLREIGFEEKQIFYNLYIPVGQNYQQIDVCVVCKIGIIVFEVKDFAGWIFGGVDEKYWYHTYRHQEKYKMYNPIRQNNVHISCMKRIINVKSFS